jgi:cytochrome c biogenesis protein CcdA
MKNRDNFFQLLLATLVLFSFLTGAKGAEKIPVVFFSTPGCEECALTRNYLESLKEIYPQIEVTEFSIGESKNKELLAHFGKTYSLPDNKINVTPAIFIGKKAFIREDAYSNAVKNTIINYDYNETKFLKDALNAVGQTNHLVELFKKFGVLTVIGAGLIDGYNPCAITVLIFFISLLVLRSKSKKDILFVGGAFTIGIGISYLLLGVGLFSIISKWRYFDEIAKWVYLVTAVITLVLAMFTLMDYVKAKLGKTKDMTLQLSTAEKKTIHSLLRNPKVQGLSIFSFLVAFPVSIVEFSCTGQTYLPTIVYIFSMPGLKARALTYLILYNVMFVLPLIVIVYFAYKGTTSDKITHWFTNNIAKIKFVTGIIFIAIFAYLLFKTLLLFGVTRF